MEQPWPLCEACDGAGCARCGNRGRRQPGCGSIANMGTATMPDPQWCVIPGPHSDRMHETAGGELWGNDDERVVGF